MRKYLIAAATGAAVATALVCGSAYAADLPTPAALPGSAPVLDWKGFYIGGNLGYGWGSANAAFANGSSGARSLSPHGFIGGVQVGYNWQFQSGLVAGVEASIDASGMTDSWTGQGAGPPGTITMTQSIGTLGSIKGKLGWAEGKWLPYVDGGLAFATSTRTESGAYNGTATRTHTGWTVGLGLEYRVNSRWSLSGEYDYADLGTQNYTVPGPTGGTNVHLTTNLVKLALNLHW